MRNILAAGVVLVIFAAIIFGVVYTTHAAPLRTPAATSIPVPSTYPATATYPPANGGSACSAKNGFCPVTPYPTTHP